MTELQQHGPLWLALLTIAIFVATAVYCYWPTAEGDF